jgi:hypothetical protein
MSDEYATENRKDSLEESDPENLARTLTIGRSDDYGNDDDFYGDDGDVNFNADGEDNSDDVEVS